MKKIYLYSVLFLISGIMNAQEYKLFGASAGNKVQLKWMSKSIKGNTSFDVFRSESNGSWQKLNTTSVVPSPVITEAELNSPKNQFPKDKSYEFYIKNKNSKETVANKKAYEAYQLSLAAIFDSQVAKHLGIYFEDNSVVNGKKYNYKVVDAQTGKELSVLNGLVAGELPAAPENFKGIQEKQNVKLSWKNNEDFMGCNIYRNGAKINAEPIMANLEKAGYQIGYVDSNLAEGSYTYVLKGITFINTESQASAEIKMEIKDATPPSVVKGVKAECKNDEVVLAWQASKDKDLSGYNVLKSTDKGKTFAKVNAQLLSEVKYVEKLEAAASGTFQYKIEALDKSNNSSKSNPVSVFAPDHHAPAIPREVASKVEKGKITLSWNSNNEKDLSGYRIYRGLKDDDENEMLLLNVTPQAQTTFVDTFNEKAGTKFIYKVTAVDKAFNESPQAAVWVQLPDVVPPSAPFLNDATYEREQVNLKWDAITNDAILGYDVYRVFEDKEEKINRTPVTTTTFSDTENTKRGVLQYYIKAIDSAKLESKPSNKITVATADFSNKKLKITVFQEVSAKKVMISYEGLKSDEIQTMKLFRKSNGTGFVRIPFAVNPSGILDETSEENKIYDYYLEVLTTDDVKLKSEIGSINNTF
ncbi:hypothetical protein EQG63_04085 [Flavobacterium amnicola]|uniref:Fibronectin type-III domain-containing protein n=1 Tax=Flavobacterium amnicola TaxID=2506422 RepID=A0A4Q1K955_9FLAO|nr:hypothetical protein [Flavobacterium amnicola]RXR21129.1 hypothetical protein EQG63_04085 [Flavobacterium amnicola]